MSVRVAEWLRSPPLKQDQSDREGPRSIPGAGKLDSGFQFVWKYEYQLDRLGVKDRALDSLRFISQERTRLTDYMAVSYTHLRAHETDSYLVCRLLLAKKKT